MDLAARDTREERFNRWARELAEAAHGAFPEPLSDPPALARQPEAPGHELSLGATALAPEGCLVLPATGRRVSFPRTNEGP